MPTLGDPGDRTAEVDDQLCFSTSDLSRRSNRHLQGRRRGRQSPVTDRHTVDQHLAAALDAVLTAVYQVKQVAWATPRSATRGALDDLKMFLFEQIQVIGEAEERIDGRSETLTSPSAHNRGNLVGEAGSVDAAVRVLAGRIRSLASDLRTRRDIIAGSDEAQLLDRAAAGLDERLDRVQPDVSAEG
jgi:hypothetical protein